jgi:anion-transporting  ArsA/GET3 family ATPase
MTIDPARRLAHAMGLDDLAPTPQRVEVPGATGELHAMMLDMQSTFDAVIDRHATDPSRARAIKQNRIYKTLSSTLSGTQEYMAMEKLHELHDEGTWDLLVIDTPPTRSALDFLDAPKRMTSFLEGKLLRVLLKPAMATGRGYLRLVGAGATALVRLAGKVTGLELLDDLADFFGNFEGMYEGFKERAEQVLELLHEPTSQFVIVTAPEPPPLREAKFFLERLEQEGLHQAGVVVNRIQPHLPDIDDAGVHRAADAQPGDEKGHAIAGALRMLADVASLGARERRDVEAALFGVPLRALLEVPLLHSDIHDLDGLHEIADCLVGSN